MRVQLEFGRACRVSEPALLAIALDRDAATHLFVALRNHRRYARTSGYAIPAALEHLEKLALSLLEPTGTVRNRLEPTSICPPAEVAPTVEAMTVTVPEAAAVLNVSRRHVERLVAGRELASTKVGRARRIPLAELERLVATREGETR